MQAQRFICQTDAQGNLPPMPVLRPNCKVEIVLLVLEEDEVFRTQPRKPHPSLAGRMVFKDDLMAPATDE